MLGTKVLLFLVFGLLIGAASSPPTSSLAYRFRPLFRPASQEQVNLDRYREVVEPLRKWLLIGVAVVLGALRRRLRLGPVAAVPALAARRAPFGTKDPYFNKDVGFYVFDLPWLHYLVDFGMAVAVLSLLAAAVVHYLFGGIRLQAKQRQALRRRAGAALGAAGLFVLFKAVDYWLDRFDLTTDGGGLFTGIGYTDQQRGAARRRTS